MDKLEDKSANKENKNCSNSSEIEHTCPICIHLLIQPIITPCKHAYCLKCYEECSELLVKNICPMCRSPIPKDFNPIVDKDYAKKLVQLFPKETLEREKQLEELKLLEKEFLKLKLNFGNTHAIVPHPKKEGETSHRWRAHLRIENLTDEQIQEYIQYVEFELHHTYVGEKKIKKFKAPFELERLAWGYFNLPIKIFFKDIVESEPIVIDHMLCFDGDGITNNQIVKIKLKKVEQDKEKDKNRGKGKSSKNVLKDSNK